MNYRYIPDNITRKIERILSRDPKAGLNKIKSSSPELSKVTYDELNVRIAQILENLLSGDEVQSARA